ncbi:hypothetical protein [Desulfospira joergensenii]|uniref:hypothetical protein n=1 Tax=Desulfospira joergensenii TaxID=53329 RepID=UPI0003B71CB7|nr:hypothetical protein [Desulfospira joergensenii]
MLDIATAYNKYKFLGNEFLTWIWYLIETEKNISEIMASKEEVSFEIGNSIVLENSLGDKSKERITIKGDQAGLEEGTTALRKGAVVTQINLICRLGQNQGQEDQDAYKFTIKGESFGLTGLKPPATAKSGSEDEIEGMVLEKAFLLSKLTQVIDTLFLKFIEKRISEEWKNKELQEIRTWILS